MQRAEPQTRTTTRLLFVETITERYPAPESRQVIDTTGEDVTPGLAKASPRYTVIQHPVYTNAWAVLDTETGVVSRDMSRTVAVRKASGKNIADRVAKRVA